MDFDYSSTLLSSINTVSNNENMKGKKNTERGPLSPTMCTMRAQFAKQSDTVGSSDVCFTLSPAKSEDIYIESWQDGPSKLWPNHHQFNDTVTPLMGEHPHLYQLSDGQTDTYPLDAVSGQLSDMPLSQNYVWSDRVGNSAGNGSLEHTQLYQFSDEQSDVNPLDKVCEQKSAVSQNYVWSDSVGSPAGDGSLDAGFPGSVLGDASLPPYLKDTIESLLPDENFLLGSTLDADIYAASNGDCGTLNLDDIELDEPLSNLILTAHPTNAVQASSPQVSSGQRRRIKSRRAGTVAALEQLQPQPLSSHPPQLEELGLERAVSPASSSGDGAGTGAGRKRRPKVSYSTLTEAQKYHRIRELNNEASRVYRQKNKESLANLQQEEEQLKKRNQVLREKVQGLEQLKDQCNDYYHQFMEQYMSGGRGGAHVPL